MTAAYCWGNLADSYWGNLADSYWGNLADYTLLNIHYLLKPIRCFAP